MEMPKTGEGLDAAREAVRIYEQLSDEEKEILKDHGIGVSEVLTIIFLQVSAERKRG
jgi:antitoxin component of RelBE/YafQ-DinJ toxin-antitoxin module